MQNPMRRFGLAVAVVGLVIGVAGGARGDLVISADFLGLSDDAGYGLTFGEGPFAHPIPPSPIQAGFTYSDNGTVTTLSVYIGAASQWTNSWDTYGSGTISELDSDRAANPNLSPIDQMFKIGHDGTLTLNIGRPYIDGNEAFRLTGTVHLLPDDMVDPSSISLYAFSGGELAHIGGPLTQLVPEPSTMISGGIAGLMGLGHAWRRRRARAAA